MARRRMRELRPEERQLWESYSRDVRPQLPGPKPAAEPSPPAQPSASNPPASPLSIPPFRIGEAAPGPDSVAVSRAGPAWDGPARMDHKTFGKMKKGRLKRDGPAPVERGVLRRQVPHWLALPPLSSAVLDVSPAHRRHGGDGALYVYLRSLR